jgi:hypothetical protein
MYSCRASSLDAYEEEGEEGESGEGGGYVMLNKKLGSTDAK